MSGLTPGDPGQIPHGWKCEDNCLTAGFEFDNFRVAMAFMTLVAFEAETMDHHPEWSNVYNKVSFRLTTHSAGNRVTDLDLKLASAISKAAASMQRSRS